MKKIGNGTYFIDKKIYFSNAYSIVGEKEANGPFGKYFSNIIHDDTLGEKSFEKAERKLHTLALCGLLKNSKMIDSDIDAIISGDLMNQLITTNYSARNFNTPLLGVYSACSSYTEALIIGCLMLDSGAAKNVIAIAGSHFSAAERQYRNPLEFGNQRQSYSQWTVTGMGATLLSCNCKTTCPCLTHFTIGKVVDYGIKDIANMGAAMAPAAMSTLLEFFNDTHTVPDDYDLIATGDLGKLGSDILKDLMIEAGLPLGQNYTDCGHMIYSSLQNSFQGGSGAGASASICNSYIYQKLKKGELKKVILVATGALMSVTTVQQGDSIPCIAHLVCFEGVDKNV